MHIKINILRNAKDIREGILWRIYEEIHAEISGETLRETPGGIPRTVYWGFFFFGKVAEEIFQ